MSNDKPKMSLRILHLEDDPRDRELVAAALDDAGWICDFIYAASETEFKDALRQPNLAVILSDFSIPSYHGLTALDCARQVRPDVPFIYVSGTIGEVRAVESLRAGATDYVLKERVERLIPVVERALREAELRRSRKQAEEQLGNSEQRLRRSEERFRQMAENIPCVFWMADAELSRMLYVSPAYERIWGRSCASFDEQPQSFFEAVHPEDRERVLADLRPKQVTAPREFEIEYRIVRPDGSFRWVRDRGFPIRDATGRLSSMVGIAEDITEAKRLQELFRHAQKIEAVGQLAGGVAHDFNNLLAVIGGNTELVLMNSDQLPVLAKDCLQQVTAAVERATGLTRQLLAFSRKQVLQPTLVNLNEVIANLTKMLRRLIGEDIELRCECGARLPYVQADISMLEQILVNLVVNARDAMPRGGSVYVTTALTRLSPAQARGNPERRAGDFICLSVRDTGTGIIPEHLPHIFEPFFTTKKLSKGTGLGLATVHGIVKQHQGWVEVTTKVQCGTTFEIFLPVIAPPPGTVSPKQREHPLCGGHETILLVEDEGAVRMTTHRVLETYGYRVLEASSGPEAVEKWVAHADEIALLLTDMVMPQGMTGRELAERLRALRKELKVVFMSGYCIDMAGKDPQYFHETKTYFLQKPYSTQDLLQIVRRCLDAKDQPCQ